MPKGEFVGQRQPQLACIECNGLTGLYQTQLTTKSGRIEHSCDMCGTGLVVRVQGDSKEHVEVTKSGTKRLKTLVLLRTQGFSGGVKHIAVHSGFFLSPDETPSEGLKRQKRLDKLRFEFLDKAIILEDYSTMDGSKIEPGTPLIHMETILVPKHTPGYRIETDYNRSFPENSASWVTLFSQLRFTGMG